MAINSQKIKEMVVANDQQLVNLQNNRVRIEQINQLGGITEASGSHDADISDRIAKTNRVFDAVRNKSISKKTITRTKVLAFNTIKTSPHLRLGADQ